jgi:hypothetical protein
VPSALRAEPGRFDALFDQQETSGGRFDEFPADPPG